MVFRRVLIATAALSPLLSIFAEGNVRLIGLVMMFASHAVVFYALLARNCRALVSVVRRFEAHGPELWLTLDDGPDPEHTADLAHELAQRGVRATFFWIASELNRCPGLVREVEALGHSVQNHTLTHPKWSFWLLTGQQLNAEIAGATNWLSAEGASAVRYFRAPAGMANLGLARVLGETGLIPVGWSVSAMDGVTCDPIKNAQRICSRSRPGSILVLHEGKSDRSGRKRSQETILATVDKLLQEGYRFVIPEPERLR